MDTPVPTPPPESDEGSAPDQGPTPTYRLTPDQLAEAERDCEELHRIWENMDTARGSTLDDRERMRSLAIWGVGSIITLAVLMLLAQRSAQPNALFGGAALLGAGLYLTLNRDAWSHASVGLSSLLFISGSFLLMWGIMVTETGEPNSEIEVIFAEQGQIPPALREEIEMQAQNLVRSLGSSLPPPPRPMTLGSSLPRELPSQITPTRGDPLREGDN
jgi:hypothetical protein